MNQNEESQDPAVFYDRMDEVMRALWGEHLHHGLWTGQESDHEAAACRLVDEVGRRLRLPPGSQVIDVGCGYGATGVQLEKEFGFRVEGVTISEYQSQQAVGGGCVTKGDWLAGFGEDEGSDGAIAIESLEHMEEAERAVKHLARVLRPGGRLALACWMRAENPTWLERVLLLDPIREAGQLPGKGCERDLIERLQHEGFRQIESEDFSEQAAPTWRACVGRGMMLLSTKPDLFKRLGWWSSFRFGLVCLRVQLAYHLGLLRYGIITATR